MKNLSVTFHRYARVDRRPLDPPPVVALRLFHVTESDSEERELPNETIQVLGLVCTVDLFPVPESTSYENSSRSPSRTSSIPPQSTTRTVLNPSPSRSPDSFYNAYSPQQETGLGDSTHRHYINKLAADYGGLYAMPNTNSALSTSAQPTNHIFPYSVQLLNRPPYPHVTCPSSPAACPDHRSQYDPSAQPQDQESTSPQTGQQPQQIVHYVDGVPIVEGTQMTHALVGAKFVQPTPVDWHGQKRLMFVFSDLAVKIEGLFINRYRIFDIFSRAAGHSDLVVQAECYGGPFRVYSTKEFPGLQASTELTKLIARYGVRLNIRETERRRRKKNGSLVSGTGKGKRKRSSDEEDDEEVDGDDD
ncbi:hypothetical protein E1B28_006332 [Marasmius oreades]|uniref:Velvet domain-containing protein n=1 Tax=Marasmius oreades TaxID=181124 RepID=A0A9P7S5M6_9AGAR|nr:uncharacterized protein E1B28_006332 [Marasmius oreades]KAG7095605.1 hypothetical protein E1B28_006332 [Marasmius oreades]